MRVFLLLILFLAPSVASAQILGGPLVPCDGTVEECQACHVVELGQNIINFLVAVSVFIGVLLFAWAGFLMVTSAGNESQISRAKGFFTAVAIGFIIVLAGWLLVDTVMKAFYRGDEAHTDGFGPWNEIVCVAQPQYLSTDDPSSGDSGRCFDEDGNEVSCTSVVPPQQTPSVTCSTCVHLPDSIATNGNACPNDATGSCQVDVTLANRLTKMNALLPSSLENSLRVSEAWPPTVTHAAECHNVGTCVDYSFNSLNDATATNINAVSLHGQLNDLRLIYEVQTDARRQELVSAGASNVIVVPGINREHFSLYMCDVGPTPSACK